VERGTAARRFGTVWHLNAPALVTVGSDMSGGVVARTLREAGIKRFARGHADDA